jgi:hypothetical protein
MKSALTLTLLAFVLLVAPPATAGSAAGVNMPDKLEMYGKELHLNGMGVRKATVLRVKVYVAGLYVENPSRNARELINSEQVKVFHMMFLRDVDQSDVADSLEEGFRGSASDYSQVRAQVEQMKRLLPSFDKGDTLTYSYRPGRGVRIAVNNKTVGTVDGRPFARALFGVWLGDSPPNAGLKRGLLGR